MHVDDRVAEWLVHWEEAAAANTTPPPLDQLPSELRFMGHEGLRLLRGFTQTLQGLATTVYSPRVGAQETPPDTPRYRFKEFLARGGMGEVWRGSDTVLAREVALKVLREQVFGDCGARARFEEEARHISGLEHPSIVPVYDLGELADGRPFFVMKLVHGQTLADLLAARATPVEDLAFWVEVFEQVCVAVAFAHTRGLIHRDLKPSNVMLGEYDTVLVMDWGIAKLLAGAQATPAWRSPSVGPAMTGDPVGPGTPAFMAPEQAGGETSRIGKATDVFGLGGILCVTLTGQPPYTHLGQVLARDTGEVFARLDGCGADAELIGLAKACLAPESEERPADAAEVARRVKSYRERVAERQAEAERLLWIRAADEAFPPAAEDARARLRQQARDLICTEVAAQARRLASASADDATAARQVLESLRDLPVLAGVRDPAALAQLPEPERKAWQKVWQEIEELLRRFNPTQ